MTTEECMRNLRDSIYSEFAKSGVTSIEAFSCHCGVGYTTLWEIISLQKPKTDIRLSTLVIISNALNLPISRLIGEKGGVI